ncbi:unnamed protein product [Leptosia nina]|uniref:Saccharopine dehydrogenase NADP binding domain-containing protein n=1 Tax=Leptosia nina TaxID=320188 RepID=A0AAV1IWW0_9NEOP
MKRQRIDLIIFGASGYTGRFVVSEMLRICQKYPNIKWAIAGRSKEKLEATLQYAKNNGENISGIEIITADAENDESLKAMCSQCKIVMNCSGPFLKYGDALVKAAIDCKTHYIDVCSEGMFLDQVLAKYDAMAQEANVFVINACGMGCLPADLGVVFMQQQFQGTLNSVEAYLTTKLKMVNSWPKNIMRDSTWEATIQETAKKPIWKREDNFSYTIDNKYRLKPRRCIHKKFDRWCVPFPGTEETVVKRTQSYFQTQRPVQFKRYHSLPSLLASLATIIGGYLLLILLKVFSLSDLFIKYPRLFSLGFVTYGDPDEKVMETLVFDYQMVGLGWKGEVQGPPRDEIIARIYPVGKKNAPYEGTAVAVIYSALTLLTERDKMPAKCGVMTPGAAFKSTTLIEKLTNDNLKFEIIRK